VYGAAQEEEKEDFLRDLGEICREQGLPLLVGGDFNLLRESADKNTSLKPTRWNDMFNYIINTCELRELEMAGGQYTWSNNHTTPTLEKLDRFLVSKEWELLFPLTTVHKLAREVLDHNPLILDTMENREQRSREFIFEKRWLKEESFLLRVDKVWAKPVNGRDSLAKFQGKLKNVRNNLKGWGANLRGFDIEKRKELNQELQNLEDIEENSPPSKEQLLRKSAIQKDLMTLFQHEEDFWHQRGRDNWLLKGDNNTEYFHRIANGHKRKKTIFSLQDGSNTIQGTHELLDHATLFYKNLFGPQASNNIKLRDDVWNIDERLSEEDRNRHTF
jgi:hypothetical protein